MSEELYEYENEEELCRRHENPVVEDRHGVGLCNVCKEENKAEELRMWKKWCMERAEAFRGKMPLRFRDKTFYNYNIENEKQKIVLEKIRNFAEKPRGTGLIMVGNVGTGKNHLAYCLAERVLQVTGEDVKVTEASKIIREIKGTWGRTDSSEEYVITKYGTGKEGNCDSHGIDSPFLLIIDEIGLQFGSDTERMYLSEIINDRYNSLLPTVLIGNVTLQELKELVGDRIIDRFKEDGQVVVFDWESHRSRGKEGK